MNSKGKLPVILLIVLILVSLSLAGGVFYLFQQERTKNLTLQGELEDIKTRLRVSEKKLTDFQNLSSTLELKLKEAESQISGLKGELQQEKTVKQEALAKIDILKTDLEQQKQLKIDLEKKFNQAQKDVEKIQAQLKDLESKKADLEARVKDLETQSEGVELGKIVVGPEGAGAVPAQVPIAATPPSKLEGKVLVVNNDYDFVVINLGGKDGVSLGNVFSVYRNNKLIGDVKVEKVNDAMAAAGYLSADIKGKINEGDRVALKSK